MLLFKLVNEFQEKTSLIVTANYSLTEWLAIPGEEAVAAALLDRLLYCCEIIQLSRSSYRMENRKTIFSNRSEDTDTLKELTTVK
jgi:DNA replication protein DnaC